MSIHLDASLFKAESVTGACGHCPMSQLTLKRGVEQIIKEHVKDVKAVEAA